MKITPSLYRVTKYNDILEDISDAVLSGSVTFDSTRKIPMTLSCELQDSVTVAPYNDYLAPFLKVEYDDGSVAESQLGLYSVVPYRQNVAMQSRKYSIDARDGCWALSEDVFSNGYTSPQGATYRSEVESILTGSGITRFAISGSSVTVPEALSWKAGTPKLDVINDLLRGMGNYPLYFDKVGVARSMAYVPMASMASSTTYSTRTPQRVGIVKTISVEPLVSEVWNKVVVVKDNSNQAPIVVTKRNMNMASPTSIPNLGREIAIVIRDGNLADQSAAEALAQKTLDEGATINNRLSLSTLPDPERGFYEAITLEAYQGETAIAVGKWFVRAWKIGFTPKDLMSFDLVSVAAPPIDTN
ncbi:MAG: hypothetical protein QM753_15925 [Thermomicrobiales bacterium]